MIEVLPVRHGDLFSEFSYPYWFFSRYAQRPKAQEVSIGQAWQQLSDFLVVSPVNFTPVFVLVWTY